MIATPLINQACAYQEQPECIADALHEELVLPEVFLVDVEDLAVVEPADQEQGDEEPDDHVDACEPQEAGTKAEGKRKQLTTPENEVQELIL